MKLFVVVHWIDYDEVDVYPFSTRELAEEFCDLLGLHKEYCISEKELDNVPDHLRS